MVVMLQMIATYCSAFVIFLILNYLWISWAAQDIYQRSLDAVVQVQTSPQPALILAILFSITLTYFVILPARRAKNIQDGIVRAAVFGAVVFGAHNLLSLTLIQTWPVGLAIIDVIWGAVVAAATTGLTFIALDYFFSNKPAPKKSKR